MHDLESLIYISRPAIRPHSIELLDIADACLRNNPLHDLTGFLYFDRSFFVQVLEGESARIETLCATLLDDPRHYGMRVLRRAPILRRRFACWDMALCDGTSPYPLFGFKPSRKLLEAAKQGDASALLSAIDSMSVPVRAAPIVAAPSSSEPHLSS